MAYQLQEINRRIQTDVQEFLAECDDNYAQRVSLAADKILTNLEHSPIVLLSGPSGSGKTTTAMKIAEELQRRGVPRELWEDALAQLPDPEEAIDKFLAAKLRGKTPDRATLQRLSAALQRRGFQWQDIRPALARLDRDMEE